MPRTATITRETLETRIDLTLNLEGEGTLTGETGIGFFDHMLGSFVKHTGFDLDLACTGDLHIDDHHTVEDVGICLGKAFVQAIGDGSGITRFGHAYAPLNEALARAVFDISGRAHLEFDADFSRSTVGDFSTEMVREFFGAFGPSRTRHPARHPDQWHKRPPPGRGGLQSVGQGPSPGRGNG